MTSRPLADEPLAAARFEALAPPQQRRVLYAVGAPKREATRLRKAVAAVEYLTGTGGRFELREFEAALGRGRTKYAPTPEASSSPLSRTNRRAHRFPRSGRLSPLTRLVFPHHLVHETVG